MPQIYCIGARHYHSIDFTGSQRNFPGSIHLLPPSRLVSLLDVLHVIVFFELNEILGRSLKQNIVQAISASVCLSVSFILQRLHQFHFRDFIFIAAECYSQK